MSDIDKVVRINGKVVPKNKMGRKVKLYEMMPAKAIEECLLASRASDKRTPEQLARDIKGIEEDTPQRLLDGYAKKMKELNKNPEAKTRKERDLST